MALTIRRCTRQKQFLDLFKELSDLCEKANWGDPHSYARGKEIYAACVLGHKVSSTLSGADAFTLEGDPLEYKSTTQKNNRGTYTGISVKPTWRKQVNYLKKEKILKYKWHYYNRFDSGVLVESWRIPGQKVYDILLPKIKKSYKKKANSTAADPRLSANVTWSEIKKYGKKII